jgi:hypothetical protein
LLGATLSKRRPQRVGRSPAKGGCIRFFIHSVSGTKAGRVKTLKSTFGSGAVESGIKQIARRIKISGASWKSEHVGQVLAHRCAYLNGLIGKSLKSA